MLCVAGRSKSRSRKGNLTGQVCPPVSPPQGPSAYLCLSSGGLLALCRMSYIRRETRDEAARGSWGFLLGGAGASAHLLGFLLEALVTDPSRAHCALPTLLPSPEPRFSSTGCFNDPPRCSCHKPAGAAGWRGRLGWKFRLAFAAPSFSAPCEPSLAAAPPLTPYFSALRDAVRLFLNSSV